MKLLFILLSIVMLLPLLASAQEFNAGFVQGLWYSEEEVFVGDPVRIYVAIRNNTGSDLTGTVEFFDGEKRIEKKSVQALDGRIIESWADWTPTFGSHTLQANLTRIELHKIGSSTQAVEVTSALAEDVLFVDYDTDNDNVGNEDDTDDDGDGVSDTEEKSNGTNPLVKNVVVQKEELKEKETAKDTRESSLQSTENKKTNKTAHNEAPVGIERYLTESPADTVLSSVTNLINQTKQNLDTYREERTLSQNEQASTSQIAVNKDGFGEISRTTNQEQKKIELPKVEGNGFIEKVFTLFGKLFNTIYTTILTILSFILGHPMFVQLGILILILFLMIKFAAKFGRRPNHKKY